MTVKVHMFAFAEAGDRSMVRMVNIPDDEFSRAKDIHTKLELVFRYGQNDFQPQPIPSVSVGDVVELDGRYFTATSAAWKEFTKKEFLALKPPTAISAFLFTGKGNI